MTTRGLTMTDRRLAVLRAIAAGTATDRAGFFTVDGVTKPRRVLDLFRDYGLVKPGWLELTAQGERLLAMPDTVILGVTTAYGPPGDGDRADWAWSTVRALWSGKERPELRPTPRATAAVAASRLAALQRLVDRAAREQSEATR